MKIKDKNYDKVLKKALTWAGEPMLDELRQITHANREKVRSILCSRWYKDNLLGSFYYYVSENPDYTTIEVDGQRVKGDVNEIFDNWVMRFTPCTPMKSLL